MAKKAEEVKVEEVKAVAAAAEVKTEEAPKKRGRKPGSTNKNKVAETVDKVKEKVEKTVTEKKKPGRKPGSSKKADAAKVVVQFYGNEVNVADVVAKANAAAGKTVSELYIKPEENAAYYVGAGVSGRVEL